MGFFSRLFGKSKDDRMLREALAKIQRILDDETFQLEFLDPATKALVESGPAYDKDPNGTGPFGFTEANPIPVNGPIGELAYLSRLETQSGWRILFHRLGAIKRVDVFEAVTFNGGEWFIFFLDCYHPRRSRSTPAGFQFTKKLPQFSGFHNHCESFPYDFDEKKRTERESGLVFAYIPIGMVTEQIQKGVFNRPLAHKAKLDLVNSRLTSFSKQ